MGKPTKKTDQDKRWAKRNLTRKAQLRPTLERILIVCEGERTEPNYFNAIYRTLPRRMIDVVVEGAGMNTISLVREAIRLRDIRKRSELPYDQVWVVFDKDDFPAGHFNTAITMCKQHALESAYSNQAFELWYLLHYEDRHTGMHRSEYAEKLTGYLGREYVKNDTTIYETLMSNGSEGDAIRRARKLDADAPEPPAAANPCTTVYKLVEELNKFKKPSDRE